MELISAKIFRSDFSKIRHGDGFAERSMSGKSDVLHSRLLHITDVTLDAEAFYEIEANGSTFGLLPIVGAVDIAGISADFLHSGQFLIFSGTTEVTLTNPYENDNVRFLLLVFTDGTGHGKSNFGITATNALFSISPGNINVNLGIYNGREGGVFFPKNAASGSFAFVVNGAFEFQNRLLEMGDGLSISEADAIEFEALSNNAILLIVETTQ